MLIVFAAAIFSFSTFNVLFIVILQGEMGLNETWYGILQAVMGISGIATSLILMSIGKIKRKIVMLNIALIGATAFLYSFAFTRNAIGIGVLLFTFGIIISIINVSAPTLIQEQIPYEKQGRVFGTQQLFQGIARILGMGIVSLVAELYDPKYIIIVAACILAVIMVWGVIYSTKSGIADDDYKDHNMLSEDTIEAKSTPTKTDAVQTSPEPAID
jgi:MFS family permease